MTDFESLGFTKDEIAQRVVDTIVRDMTQQRQSDEYGDEWFGQSEFVKSIEEQVRDRIKAEVERVGEEHITPRVAELIDNTTLQETNSWGEAKGEPVTFTEYLVQRAEGYLTEKVNYEGKTKGENRGMSWSASTTRVSYMIDKHLQYHISQAMKKALEDANSQIVEGINGAVKIALKNLKVTTSATVKS